MFSQRAPQMREEKLLVIWAYRAHRDVRLADWVIAIAEEDGEIAGPKADAIAVLNSMGYDISGYLDDE